MAATFAVPRFEKFIPYAPSRPKTARRPPSKEASARTPEWLDIDEMIKGLDEQGDRFLDTLAATSSFGPSDAGVQTGNPQNTRKDTKHGESSKVTGDNGKVSEIATPSVPFLSPADHAFGPQAALGEEEDCSLECDDHQPESPHIIVDLLDDIVDDAGVQSVQMSEYCDGTPLADPGGVLRSDGERQDMDNAQPAVSKDAVDPGKQSSEVADGTYLGSGDARAPSQSSNVELDLCDDSVFEVWPSGTSFVDSSDDEIRPRQPKRARRQRKRRAPYSRKQVTPSISKGQGSWRVHKTMPLRRSPHGSSRRRSDWAINTDGPQNLLHPRWTSGGLKPQKLTQISLRQLASGETFMAAVIQDERKVAALDYDQSVMLIKRSIGCDWEVDGLCIMPIGLNSWLVTGFLRMDECQDPCQSAQSPYLINDEIERSLAGRTCYSNAEHAEPDRSTGFLHEAMSQDNRGSIEDDLQLSDDSEKPDVTAGPRKPPWTLKEEQIVADLVDHKNWKEIGEVLGRPPGGVSQRWRKMQLAAAGGVKPRLRRKHNRAQ